MTAALALMCLLAVGAVVGRAVDALIDGVERAVGSDAGDAEKIVERNIATLRGLGADGWATLLKP